MRKIGVRTKYNNEAIHLRSRYLERWHKGQLSWRLQVTVETFDFKMGITSWIK
jgi:hypothetical protein